MLLGNYHLSKWTGRPAFQGWTPETSNAREPLATMESGLSAISRFARESDSSLFLRRDLIPHLTAFPILLFCIRCFNQQRLSRVAEGTGPLKPQQPGANAKVLIPAQVGRDKILD
jgi:hypothetical protein